MTISLTETGDAACTFEEATNSSTNRFTVPISKVALVGLLRDMLMTPGRRDVGDGLIRVDRVRDGLRVHAGNGMFMLPYPQLFPIVVEG